MFLISSSGGKEVKYSRNTIKKQTGNLSKSFAEQGPSPL
jgi:hypothetical protein